MNPQKFRAGQMVTVIPSPYIPSLRGDFSIVCVLPEEHGMYQYRIKAITDESVHVVMESEIV